jgi:hypothetical protein
VGIINVSGSACPVVTASAERVNLLAGSAGTPPSVTVTGAVGNIRTEGTGAVGNISIGGGAAPIVNIGGGVTASDVIVSGNAAPSFNVGGSISDVLSTSTQQIVFQGEGIVDHYYAELVDTIVADGGNTLPITITLESIAVTSYPTKLNYALNEALNTDNLVITGTYSVIGCPNKMRIADTVLPNEISGFDSSTPGMKLLTITKNGKTAFFSVFVIAKTANLITINTLPKLSYEKNEALDVSKGKINVSYTSSTLYPDETIQ